MIKDFSDHNHFQEKAVEEKPLPLEQCPPTPSKTIITLTPIKELVKKIVIPISVASDKLTCQNNHKPSSNNGNSHPVEVDNSTIDEPELEYRTSLKPEKTPSSINQFVPLSDSSDFYRKSRAVAHQQFQENQEN